MRQVMTDVGALRKTDKVMLVRREDIPSVTPEQARQIGMITGRGVKENPTANILFYGKGLMRERNCYLIDIRTNKVMVAYAGRPYKTKK